MHWKMCYGRQAIGLIGSIRKAFKAKIAFSPVIWRQKVYVHACGHSS